MLGLIEGHTSCDHCSGLDLGSAWLKNYFEIKKTPDPMIIDAEAGDKIYFSGKEGGSFFVSGGYLDENYDGNTAGKVIGNEEKPVPIFAMFDYFRYRDGDGNNEIWTTTVPVYKEEGACKNPSGLIEIVGFATIEVHMPNPPPDKTLNVYVYCDQTVEEGRGGGMHYGKLKGSIPNLVK